MERMAHRVAEELGLDEDAAQVVTDENEIADPKLRKAKGWFDTTTGKITVVIPNHTGVQQDGDVAAGSGAARMQEEVDEAKRLLRGKVIWHKPNN